MMKVLLINWNEKRQQFVILNSLSTAQWLLTKYEILILKYYRGLAKRWETRKKQKSKEISYKTTFAACLKNSKAIGLPSSSTF